MPTSEQQVVFLSTLLQLEKRIRNAETIAELGFCLVNETLRLVPYKQAILWEIGLAGKMSVRAVSGVDKPEQNAPLLIFLKKLLKQSFSKGLPRTPVALMLDDLDPSLRQQCITWECGQILWVPIVSPHQDMLGGMLVLRPNPWGEQETSFFARMAETAGHAWLTLRKKKGMLQRTTSSVWKKNIFKVTVVAVLLGILCLPVHLSALAPAKILPRHPLIVSPAMDGVIKDVLITPNQHVTSGQPLFTLDDTALSNRFKVGQKEVQVVQAEYNNIQQKAFNDPEAREKILFLKAQLDQQSSELEYIGELLEKTVVKAQQAGITIFKDRNEWLGKPVVIGEKVMTLANPDQVELEIMLPSDNAINLPSEAEILFFQNIAPEAPLKARLRTMSYEAHLTPEGFLAFTLKATLLDNTTIPRIGLRGTAKVYGRKVPLAYYLLRRPLTALRTRMGI